MNPYPEGTGEWLLYEIFAEEVSDEREASPEA